MARLPSCFPFSFWRGRGFVIQPLAYIPTFWRYTWGATRVAFLSFLGLLSACAVIGNNGRRLFSLKLFLFSFSLAYPSSSPDLPCSSVVPTPNVQGAVMSLRVVGEGFAAPMFTQVKRRRAGYGTAWLGS